MGRLRGAITTITILNMEGDGDYRAEEYYEGDGGLGYVQLPGVDDAPTGGGRLILRRRRRQRRGGRGVRVYYEYDESNV